ncbi:MAG TPA: hypothetical protein VFE33_07580 [Thermoanaerobaculia bacterium]|nr:hypothetical protein [Thermoanaerobaculia bacterium]
MVTVELVKKYASSYLGTFIATLIAPSRVALFYAIVPPKSDRIISSELSIPAIADIHLRDELAVYVVANVVVGFAVSSAIPGREGMQPVFVAATISVALWSIVAFLTHVVVLALRAQNARLLTTFSLSVHLLSTIYVVASIVTFILCAVERVVAPANTALSYGVVWPELWSPLIQSLMWVVYLPATIGGTYRFGWARRIGLAILPTSLASVLSAAALFFLALVAMSARSC